MIIEPAVKNYLSEHYGDDAYTGYDGYVANGGFEGLRAALALEPAEVTERVRASGLRSGSAR